jgi:hypothetical protein
MASRTRDCSLLHTLVAVLMRPEVSYDAGMKALVSELIIRPSDWEFELNCPEHGNFFVFAGNLIQPK